MSKISASGARAERAGAGRKVALVLHKFSRGGSDRVASHLANGFVEAGLRVELVVLCRGGEVEAVLSDLLSPAVRVTCLGRESGSRVLDLVRGLPALARHLRREMPDAVISTANNTAWITALALKLARLPGTRLIFKTTNPVARSRHRGIGAWLRHQGYARAFRRVDAVWALSAEEAGELRAEFGKSADRFEAVVQPYVTPAMLAGPVLAGPVPAASDKSHKHVVCVARLTSQKRLDLLVEAFASIEDRSATLTILGEGEDRGALTALIARLGLDDRVRMPGYDPNVIDTLRRADLFVLTSRYEGLPAAVLEAMAANCPVISTDCFPSARALMGEGEGCAIIETTDPPALARMIDAHLRATRPTRLRAIAARYALAEGVASHVDALARCLAREPDPVRRDADAPSPLASPSTRS